MNRPHENYQAYTVRLSRVCETGAWRATVYCAISGQRWHFADMDQLCAFLQQAGIEPPDAEIQRGSLIDHQPDHHRCVPLGADTQEL